MQPTRSRCRRTSAADRPARVAGHTVIELAITCSLLMLVLGVLFTTLDNVVKAQGYTADRTASLDTMRITLNVMTRELRQASSVNEATSTTTRIEFDTYGAQGPRHVVYDATGTTLTRTIDGGSAVTVLTGLASTNVFSYVTAPPVPGAQWVHINLRVRPRFAPETILVLDSEVNLRNRTGALT